MATGLPTANNRPSCTTSGGQPPACLQDRNDTVVNPRVAALYHLTGAVSVWGDFGLGFRAPTLNELYRQFAVGAVVTRANDQLGPERLVGGELGVNIAPAPNVTVRSTWFDNRVTQPGIQRHDRHQPAAATEPWTDEDLGDSERRRVPARLGLAVLGRLSLQSGAGRGIRRHAGARQRLPGPPRKRLLPPPGTQETRVGARGVLESTLCDRGGRDAVRRPSVPTRIGMSAPFRRRLSPMRAIPLPPRPDCPVTG